MTACITVRNRTADSDSDLVRSAVAGDQTAISTLYKKYRIQFRVWISRHLQHKEWCGEFADAAAANLIEVLPQYNCALSAFRTWAFRVAYTAVIKYIRKLQTERDDVCAIDLVTEMLPALRSPELDYVYRRVHEEVEKLEPEQRSAVEGRFFEGLSDREISERHHMPRRKVCYRRRQGLVVLAERLADVAFKSIRPETRFSGYNYVVTRNPRVDNPALLGGKEGDCT